MAVYTHLDSSDITGLLCHYDLGDFLSYQGITQGVENTNYIVETTCGRYILTLFEKRVDQSNLSFYLSAMRLWNEHGINAPIPQKRKDGNDITHISNKPAIFVSFLKGQGLERPDLNQVKNMGIYLSKLHKAGVTFDIAKANNVNLDYCLNICQHVQSTHSSELPPLWQDMILEGKQLKMVLPQLGNADLPKGIMHLDLFPDNVFFKQELPVAIIDVYFAATDYRIYDLAITFNAWCFDASGKFDLQKGLAFLNAYLAKCQLTEDEQKNFPLMCRLASFRFFATRCYDWYHTCSNANVHKKDPSEYGYINQFHHDKSRLEDYLI